MGPAGRGVLYPARLPTFRRVPAPVEVAELVGWFWIPEWAIEPGRTSRQHVISHPACNLVVEPATVGLAGPTTHATHRDLAGTGWAVGALLRPAAVPFVAELAGAVTGRGRADPGALRDRYVPLDRPELAGPVRAAMAGGGDGDGGGDGASGGDRVADAVAAFAGWITATAPRPDRAALLANAMVDLIENDPRVVTVDDVAVRLHVSARTVERLGRGYVGLPPLAMIRRRRLHEAAQRLRTDPDTTLAILAAELGYADQAHLANDFRVSLGVTPSGYRFQNQIGS